MRNRTLIGLTLALVAGLGLGAAEPPRILLNHLGFDPEAPKQAVVMADLKAGTPFRVLDGAGRVAFEGRAGAQERVDRWHLGPFARLDLGALKVPGSYRVEVDLGQGRVASHPFEIRPRLLAEDCLPDLFNHFHTQRSAGVYDRTDRAVPFTGDRKGTVDVRGGWYDASGDYSKYLSHLTYTNVMTPQHTPLAVWSFLASADRLGAAKGERLPALAERAREEAFHGADFLVRMQDPEGYFYISVFDVWSHDPAKRTVCAYKTQDGIKFDGYQAAWREGGGMAIAALARISKVAAPGGEFPSERYLAAAEKGFAHLQANGSRYADDGKENFIDDYCALMAASELFAATGRPAYLEAARVRARAMAARQGTEGAGAGFFRVNEAGRPYFHAAEEGLPVVALLRYRALEPEASRKAEALVTVRRALEGQLRLTEGVANPFGLARQWVQDLGGTPRASFFFPHRNESGYWWQGENARLASLAAAARLGAAALPDLAPRLQAHAQRQVDWILGANPYDMCMMQGRGRGNPDYLADFPNAPGGVCNGITSGFTDEADIAFLPEPQGKDPNQNWRWSEQWIPHAAWLVLALSVDQ